VNEFINLEKTQDEVNYLLYIKSNQLSDEIDEIEANIKKYEYEIE
jgi:hypothetical protein